MSVFHSIIILNLVSFIVEHPCASKFEEIESDKQPVDCFDKSNYLNIILSQMLLSR